MTTHVKYSIYFVRVEESLSTEMCTGLALSEDHITLSCVVLYAAQPVNCYTPGTGQDAQQQILSRKKAQNIHIPTQLAVFNCLLVKKH